MTAAEPVKSTHRVEVVPVRLEPIPGADKVALARVHGYTCVTARDQWADGALGAYVPPDSLVDPARPEFAFLARDARGDGLVRIKAKKLRGVLSFGLLVPAPPGSRAGDDVAARLGVTHYEPPVKGFGGVPGTSLGGEECAGPPLGHVPTYDVEAFRRYAHEVFTPGEPVVVTEKIHGANARYTFCGGRMYCGSRTAWKREYPSYDHLSPEDIAARFRAADAALEAAAALRRAEALVADLKARPRQKNLWWQALDRTPDLRAFCEAHPGVVVYGEVYGAVQDLAYGHKAGEVSFAAFDLWADGRWASWLEARAMTAGTGLPWVPVLPAADGYPAFHFDALCAMAEGQSTVPGADHVREGVVVRPPVERRDDRIGRVQLKIVGCGYLERSK